MAVKTWIGKLDGGQLDVMWNYLRFKGEGINVKEVENLEKSLDELRTLMIQKSAGQPNRESKTSGYVEFEDLETVLNNIIIETMWIYLGGGFTKLKGVIENNDRK
jgi:hypothetical protein